MSLFVEGDKPEVKYLVFISKVWFFCIWTVEVVGEPIYNSAGISLTLEKAMVKSKKRLLSIKSAKEKR